MSRSIDVFSSLDEDFSPVEAAARTLGCAIEDIASTRVLRRSLDARKGHRMGFRVRLQVQLVGEAFAEELHERPGIAWDPSIARPKVVIVGSGPAGMWAALRLAEAGVTSTILERGKPIQPRRRDLASVQRGQLDPESNYCFGEGGAGTVYAQ